MKSDLSAVRANTLAGEIADSPARRTQPAPRRALELWKDKIMFRYLRSALAGFIACAAIPALVSAATIRDEAKMFSPAAVECAKSILDAVERDHGMPIFVLTVPSLDGEELRKATEERAREMMKSGVFVLISKADHKLEVLPSRHFRTGITQGLATEIRDKFLAEFRKSRFDEGLLSGALEIQRIAEERNIHANRAAVGGPVRAANRGGGGWLGPLFWILALILGVTVLIRIFSSIGAGNRMVQTGPPGGMGGPMGQPMGGGYGYGGRGGGFWSGLLGGLGGAIAGNWIYDQMSGRHHGSQSGMADGGEARLGPGSDW